MWRRSLTVARTSAVAAGPSTLTALAAPVLPHPGCRLCLATAGPSSSTSSSLLRTFVSSAAPARGGSQQKPSRGGYKDRSGSLPELSTVEIWRTRRQRWQGQERPIRQRQVSAGPEGPGKGCRLFSAGAAYVSRGREEARRATHSHGERSRIALATSGVRNQRQAGGAASPFPSGDISERRPRTVKRLAKANKRGDDGDGDPALPDMVRASQGLDTRSSRPARHRQDGSYGNLFESTRCRLLVHHGRRECLGRFCISAFLDWIDQGLDTSMPPSNANPLRPKAKSQK